MNKVYVAGASLHMPCIAQKLILFYLLWFILISKSLLKLVLVLAQLPWHSWWAVIMDTPLKRANPHPYCFTPLSSMLQALWKC